MCVRKVMSFWSLHVPQSDESKGAPRMCGGIDQIVGWRSPFGVGVPLLGYSRSATEEYVRQLLVFWHMKAFHWKVNHPCPRPHNRTAHTTENNTLPIPSDACSNDLGLLMMINDVLLLK